MIATMFIALHTLSQFCIIWQIPICVYKYVTENPCSIEARDNSNERLECRMQLFSLVSFCRKEETEGLTRVRGQGSHVRPACTTHGYMQWVVFYPCFQRTLHFRTLKAIHEILCTHDRQYEEQSYSAGTSSYRRTISLSHIQCDIYTPYTYKSYIPELSLSPDGACY